MHIALETIILQDVFGRDNQYLKGHEYELTYSDWDMVKVNGRYVQSFNLHFLISEEDMNKYFKCEHREVVKVSRGSRVLKVQ